MALPGAPRRRRDLPETVRIAVEVGEQARRCDARRDRTRCRARSRSIRGPERARARGHPGGSIARPRCRAARTLRNEVPRGGRGRRLRRPPPQISRAPPRKRDMPALPSRTGRRRRDPPGDRRRSPHPASDVRSPPPDSRGRARARAPRGPPTITTAQASIKRPWRRAAGSSGNEISARRSTTGACVPRQEGDRRRRVADVATRLLVAGRVGGRFVEERLRRGKVRQRAQSDGGGRERRDEVRVVRSAQKVDGSVEDGADDRAPGIRRVDARPSEEGDVTLDPRDHLRGVDRAGRREHVGEEHDARQDGVRALRVRHEQRPRGGARRRLGLRSPPSRTPRRRGRRSRPGRDRPLRASGARRAHGPRERPGASRPRADDRACDPRR